MNAQITYLRASQHIADLAVAKSAGERQATTLTREAVGRSDATAERLRWLPGHAVNGSEAARMIRAVVVLAVIVGVWAMASGTASARPLVNVPNVVTTCQPDPLDLFVAVDDSYNLTAGAFVGNEPSVLANDYVDDAGTHEALANAPMLYGEPVAALLYVGPMHGTVTLNADGSFSYQSNLQEDQSGTDSFTYVYQVNGPNKPCSNLATVTLNLSPRQPIANWDDYGISSDQTLSVGDPSTPTGSPTGVLANDENLLKFLYVPDNLYAQLVSTTQPGGGQLDGTLTWPTSGPDSEDGSFTYTPASPTTLPGTRSFTYEACLFERSGPGPYCSDPGIVAIDILPTVHGHPDSYSVAEDGTLQVGTSAGVFGNDVNNTGSPLSATVTQQPADGTLAFDSSTGTFTYTPNQGFYTGFTPDTFSYTPCAQYQGKAVCSAPTTVSINVNPVSPTASVQAPAKIVGQRFVVTFTDPAGQSQIGVRNVTSSDFTITPQGSTTPLGGTMVCEDNAASAVDCATGNVVTVSFKPSATLAAGQTYHLNLNNQPGLNRETEICQQDLFAACVTPQSLSARVALVVQAGDPGPSYEWGTVENASAQGSSYVQEQYADASEKYSFSGSSFGLVVWTRPDGGTATVRITSATAKTTTRTIDTYAALARDHTFSWASLPAGKHTVTITTTEAHRAASTGSWVTIDGVVVDGATTATPSLTATWSDGPGYGYVFTGQKRASAELSFYGAGITWSGVVGPNDGMARVTISGSALATPIVKTVDLYAPSYVYQDVFATGLPSYGHYLIKIVALGAKESASTNTIVALKTLTIS
jgi:hypothetical protein